MFFVFDGNLVELGAGLIIEGGHGLFAGHVFLRSQFLHLLVLHHQFYFLLHSLGFLLFVYFGLVCLHSGYFYL